VPVSYQIDAAQKTVRTRCVSPLLLEEVVQHFYALQQDPACPRELDVLLDLTETTSAPQQHELKAVAFSIADVRGRVKFGACAIVAPRDAMFGMMRMFEVFAQKSFRATAVFRTLAEAEAWLATQQLQPERE